ncbi:fumarylacetoacetate hydrolase family protein [Hymenobacter sp. BRD67]|uniref:fumarylacetoacetate hydrolase family protein n=1 Tax=Hymenobacter sp. BRD67 TaxID=2675877 RepID=UPI0015668D28|nr:fumarylacetoacetate hydrolase family protein [Hymenobacter sp. BRD67]QKG53052.1 fumarylacetoacetate hydrolase family protein [Hymenobacter sp. BRD67]
MLLIRHGQPGHEKPGVVLDGHHYDVSDFAEDYDERFFATDGLRRLAAFVDVQRELLLPVPATQRLGPPVARPSKIVCAGLNYTDHAQEMGLPLPTEPVLFLKAPSALTGPNDAIILPKNSVKTDWEVELAVVIRKRAAYVDEADALNYVAGYVLLNDVSERAYQLERGGTWDKGKGCDTFAPLGPWLVTPDELADPANLRLWLKVNGETYQSGSTANLIFGVAYLISYISQFMTLLPGDIISTGTPAGVGSGLKPPRFLAPGDVVELGITGLGVARQTVRSF